MAVCDRNGGSVQQFTAQATGSIRGQRLHCQVEALGFSTGIFPRKHAEPGAGGNLAAEVALKR